MEQLLNTEHVVTLYFVMGFITSYWVFFSLEDSSKFYEPWKIFLLSVLSFFFWPASMAICAFKWLRKKFLEVHHP